MFCFPDGWAVAEVSLATGLPYVVTIPQGAAAGRRLLVSYRSDAAGNTAHTEWELGEPPFEETLTPEGIPEPPVEP